MDLGLKGKRAVITGATKGIGRRIAERFAAEGVDIAICARNAADVEEAVAALKAQGGRVVGAPVNVRKDDEYRKWLETAAAELGGVDIFVPNVSAGGGMDGEKNWWANFEIDVLGTVRGCETLLPQLEQSSAGSIVIIGSTNAVEAFAGPMAYNSMKAALVTYCNGLSQTVAGKGIRVNTVSPGPIYFEGGAWATIKEAMPDFYNDALAKIPGGKMGTPEEVANVVAFIASPAASLVTGANIIADNGFTKRVQY